MSLIHYRVQVLLDAIAESQSIAYFATARVLSAEADAGSSNSEERDPFAPASGEDAVSRGLRQLRIADEVVSGLLMRELSLWERSRALLNEFNERTASVAERSSGYIETVVATVEDEDGHFTSTDLLSERRRNELEYLLAEWKQGVTLTERILLGDGA